MSYYRDRTHERMVNAGQYNKRITIYRVEITRDAQGFQKKTKTIILRPYAAIRTIRGFTLIANNSSFEKAYTNFTIRYPKTEITRDMLIDFHGQTYTIEYLNNVDENGVELEIQAKEVEK